MSIDLVAMDLLHSMDSGVLQRFSGHILWTMLDAKCYISEGINALMAPEDALHAGMSNIRGELHAYYDKIYAKKTASGQKLPQFWDLTLEMIGTRKSPTLSGKGLEIRSMLGFLIQELSKPEVKLHACSNICS